MTFLLRTVGKLIIVLSLKLWRHFGFVMLQLLSSVWVGAGGKRKGYVDLGRVGVDGGGVYWRDARGKVNIHVTL